MHLFLWGKKYFSSKEYLYNLEKIFFIVINLDIHNIVFTKTVIFYLLVFLIASCLYTKSNHLLQSKLILVYLYSHKSSIRNRLQVLYSVRFIFHAYNNNVCKSKFTNFQECSILIKIFLQQLFVIKHAFYYTYNLNHIGYFLHVLALVESNVLNFWHKHYSKSLLCVIIPKSSIELLSLTEMYCNEWENYQLIL